MSQLDPQGMVNKLLDTILNGGTLDLTNNTLKVEERFSYYNVPSSAMTGVIKTGAGFLHSVNLGLKGAANSAITIYDNSAASGNVIGIFNTTDAQFPLLLDVSFTVGLTVVTAAASNVTLSYR